MANRILIKELSQIAEWFEHKAETGYHGDVRDYEGAAHTIMSAVELLKEQEAVEPKIVPSAKGIFYTCGICGHGLVEIRDTVSFDDRKRIRFCTWCGKKVKWE